VDQSCVWNLNFNSSLSDVPSLQTLINVSSTTSTPPAAQSDFVVSLSFSTNILPAVSFTGYSVFLTIPANQSSNSLGSIQITNGSNANIVIKSPFPFMDLVIRDALAASLTIGAIRDVAIFNSDNVLVSGGSFSNELFLRNVDNVEMLNIVSTPIKLFANWSSLESLTRILVTGAINSTVQLLQAVDVAPSPDVFQLAVHSCHFLQGSDQSVIMNPYGQVWIDATQNYFGPTGPTTSSLSPPIGNCNPTGTGPKISDNVIFNNWCLNNSCSTFNTSGCGATNGTTTGVTSTGATTTATSTSTTTTTTATSTSTTATSTATTTGPTPTPHPGGLTGGQIAGIVIGVVLGIAFVGTLVYYFLIREKNQLTQGYQEL